MTNSFAPNKKKKKIVCMVVWWYSFVPLWGGIIFFGRTIMHRLFFLSFGDTLLHYTTNIEHLNHKGQIKESHGPCAFCGGENSQWYTGVALACHAMPYPFMSHIWLFGIFFFLF